VPRWAGGKWRARFLKGRLERCMMSRGRSAAHRQRSPVEQVVIQHWKHAARRTSLVDAWISRATGLSRMTISRIWHAFGFNNPHRAVYVQRCRQIRN